MADQISGIKEVSLIDVDFVKLINEKKIKSICESINLKSYIQPASLDIPVSSKAYLVKFKFLPFKKKISHVVDSIKLEELDLDNNPILFKDNSYLIPCINLNGINDKYLGRVSPKSSIGRVDLMVRAINDNSPYYDYLEKVEGVVWLEVTPRSFNIKLKTGIALAQLKLFERKKINFDLTKEKLVYNGKGKVQKTKFYSDDEVLLRIEIPNKEIIGYEARVSNEIIDLSRVNTHDRNKYFKEVKKVGTNYNKLVLEKNKFYILKTKEFIQFPPHLSGELLPISNLLGEFRVHYAGFFDPGFGFGIKGNQAVLEVRPHENLIVYDSQPICIMRYYPNRTRPKKIYGEAGNNYSKQKKVRLAKYFKD
jgi:dCTP deaminase